jgi:hypothetical protein
VRQAGLTGGGGGGATSGTSGGGGMPVSGGGPGGPGGFQSGSYSPPGPYFDFIDSKSPISLKRDLTSENNTQKSKLTVEVPVSLHESSQLRQAASALPSPTLC